VFENRVLRRIVGPKRDEVTGEWSRLHNEELHDLYCLSNIVREIISGRMRWAGHAESMGNRKVVYRDFQEMLEGMRPLRRHRCRWKDYKNRL